MWVEKLGMIDGFICYLDGVLVSFKVDVGVG